MSLLLLGRDVILRMVKGTNPLLPDERTASRGEDPL